MATLSWNSVLTLMTAFSITFSVLSNAAPLRVKRMETTLEYGPYFDKVTHLGGGFQTFLTQVSRPRILDKRVYFEFSENIVPEIGNIQCHEETTHYPYDKKSWRYLQQSQEWSSRVMSVEESEIQRPEPVTRARKLHRCLRESQWTNSYCEDVLVLTGKSGNALNIVFRKGKPHYIYSTLSHKEYYFFQLEKCTSFKLGHRITEVFSR